MQEIVSLDTRIVNTVAGLMIMASHQTFSSQIKPTKSNLAKQIFYTLSMEFTKENGSIFSPYHKHSCGCLRDHSN